jgi:hypothetical protein
VNVGRGGGRRWAKRGWGGWWGRRVFWVQGGVVVALVDALKLDICDDFTSFFYLFFKVFLVCKSLVFSDLWRLGKRRKGGAGFTLLSY